jgi:hypothetical protein
MNRATVCTCPGFKEWEVYPNLDSGLKSTPSGNLCQPKTSEKVVWIHLHSGRMIMIFPKGSFQFFLWLYSWPLPPAINCMV